MLLFSICSIKLQLQKVKYSSKQQFPGPNRNTLSRVHCTRVQWWLVYPVSNFDYEQRKVFQRCGSLPIFFANFVTAKWSVNGDVNAADTRAKCLNISVAARKNCIQQFCMVRQAVFFEKKNGLSIQSASNLYVAHLRLWSRDPAPMRSLVLSSQDASGF